MITVFLIAWYISGFLAPVYYFQRDWNDPCEGAVIGVFCGLLGPFAWLLGYYIHNKWYTNE